MASAALSPSDEGVLCRVGDRYVLSSAFAAGGMAQVHLGRVLGAGGFRRTVAVKRLHPHLARDGYFMSMLVDEARLAARVRHPNVVGTIDVAAMGGELLLVMEYVHGEPLSAILHGLRTCGERMPLPIASAVLSGVLLGLHAAHEARDEDGHPLGIVHRDVSPANILLDVDGLARVVDFGVAKASGRLQLTRSGQIKGKFAYMAPEQLEGGDLDRRADVYAASVVLWECLTNRRLFRGESEADVFRDAMLARVVAPGKVAPNVPKAVDDVIMNGLARDPAARYATARDMALALEGAMQPATPARVSEWLQRVAGESLAARERAIATFERALRSSPTAEVAPVEQEAPRIESGRSEVQSPQLPANRLEAESLEPDPPTLAYAPPATRPTAVAEGLPAGWTALAQEEEPPTVARAPADSAVRRSDSAVRSSPLPSGVGRSVPSSPLPSGVRHSVRMDSVRSVPGVVADIEGRRSGISGLRRWLGTRAGSAVHVGTAAAVLGAGTIAIVWWSSARHAPAASTTSPPVEVRSYEPRGTATVPVTPAPSVESADERTPSPELPELAAIVAPSEASAAPSAMAPTATPAVRTASPSGSIRAPMPSIKPKRKSCDPPWTLGNDGIRHPRPECL
jgi:serine/threonine-protein kinase